MPSFKWLFSLIVLPFLMTHCLAEEAETKSQPVKIQVLNPDGSPAVGVKIGQLLYNTGIDNPEGRMRFSFLGDDRLNEEELLPFQRSNEKGELSVPRTTLFFSGDKRQRIVLAMSDDHGLMGFQTLLPNDSKTEISIQLQPTISVEISPRCQALEDLGRPLAKTVLNIYFANFPAYELITSKKSHQIRLPLGEYEVRASASEVYGRKVKLSITGNKEVISKTVDLMPTKIEMLVGKPAPEFRQIKDWYGAEPITLESLRGKVVVLDFWGYWCGPCVYRMPELFTLLEKHRDDGLVVIGIHDDSIKDAKELNEKLISIRKDLWDGKDVPYPIAIDGGGEIEVPGRHAPVRGATTAAYGIARWPTYLLIDREGIMRGKFYPSKAEDMKFLKQLLGVEDNGKNEDRQTPPK